MKNIFITLFFALALLAFVAPLAFAADAQFVPIAPLPGVDTGGGQTLEGYVNAVFTLALSFGVILALLFFIIGGFEYMTSEALSAKDEGKKRMQSSLYGLLLLLLSWLILYIINPDILSLNALNSFGG